MNIKGMVKVFALTSAAALFALCMTACNGGKVAATVDDTKIMEDDITAEIQKYRESYGMSDNDTWAQYMGYYGYTPSTIRESMIDSHIQDALVKKAAKENGISVDKADIDTYVNQIKANYDSDDNWKKALESAGLTEDKYRENIEQALLEQKLMQTVCADKEPAEADVLSYASMYASYSYNGAKKSSHILFDAADQETAQSVLDQINSGSITFEDAAKQYSKDSSAADGGNVGWDCLNSFVTEYQNALSALDPDQVSGLVNSQFGIHIIKCTEKFTAPEELTSISQLPTEMADAVKTMVKQYSQQSDFQTWLGEYREKANVTVNEMPSGLPYDVDMSAYENAILNTDSAEGDQNTAAEGEGEKEATAEATEDSTKKAE